MTTLRHSLPWIGAILSGLFLFTAFPPLEWDDAGWIALVPLIMAARALPPTKAWMLSFVAGFTFWVGTLFWVHHVSYIGWIALAFVCAVLGAPYASFVSWYARKHGTKHWYKNVGLMFASATAWVALEYVRGIIFTGFPWNQLAVSQYRNVVLLQTASFGGVYIVSALMVWVNTAIAVTLLQYVDIKGRHIKRVHPELMFGFLVLALAFMYGVKAIRPTPAAETPVQIALIQPNIAQNEKWTPEKVDYIYRTLWEKTDAAHHGGNVDLIVWPETAVPDDIRYSERSYGLVKALTTNDVPLLVGSMDTVWIDEETPVYFNSSFLFGHDGELLERYDKRHLVVFGEYVPMRKVFPFLKAMTPIQESFTPGMTSTVFRLQDPPISFSVLICFEDTVDRLAAESVRNGARLLIVQTNDGWFEESWNSRQHMSHCVFRCIENRVPAVRAANTGVTSVFDKHGRIRAELLDASGKPFFDGLLSREVLVPGDSMDLTFYSRHGNLFAMACLALTIFALCRMVLECRSEARSPAGME